MLHTRLRYLILPLWAAWLTLAATERPTSVACQIAAGAAKVAATSHAMPGSAGMHHGAHQSPGRDAPPNCCGCLGDCGTASVATIPSGGIVAVRFTPIVSCAAETIDGLVPAIRPDLVLPYPNAPPLSPLIA